jgi:hypothetical protein
MVLGTNTSLNTVYRIRRIVPRKLSGAGQIKHHTCGVHVLLMTESRGGSLSKAMAAWIRMGGAGWVKPSVASWGGRGRGVETACVRRDGA